MSRAINKVGDRLWGYYDEDCDCVYQNFVFEDKSVAEWCRQGNLIVVEVCFDGERWNLVSSPDQ